MEFIGFMSIIIFSGAIIILFIFVLMLVNFKRFKDIDYSLSEILKGLFNYSLIFLILLLISLQDQMLIISYIFEESFKGTNMEMSQFVYDLFILKWFLFSRNFNEINILLEHSSLYKIAYILEITLSYLFKKGFCS